MADTQDVSQRVRANALKRVPPAPARPRADAPTKPETDAPVRRTDPHEPPPAGAPGAPPERAGEPGGRDRQPPARRRRSRLPGLLIALVVAVLVIGGVIYWFSSGGTVSTDDAFTDGNAIMIAPHVSGYVVKLAVNDNEFVHQGQLLVKIDPRDFIAARDQAKAQLDLAQAQLHNAQVAHQIAMTTFPARRESAQARLDAAKATQAKAAADYRRYSTVNPAAVTREQLDSARAALAQANANVAQAQAALNEANLVPQNIEQAVRVINQWQAQVEVAEAQLEQANLNLSYTDVTAPHDGWVTRRNVDQGNYVQQATQIMALVSPDVWITANFKETELAHMRAGDPVTIGVDAYPFLHLNGHVDSIQKGSGSKFSAFPAENATGNFVKIVQRVPVKIVIDRGLDPRLPMPLGLSVEPTVTLKSSGSPLAGRAPTAAHGGGK